MSDRKQEILEVAAELLLVKGYCGFSYQDLSDRLGITKASIHHHFASKEALGIAICDHFEAWHYQVMEAAGGSGAGPKALIEAKLEMGAQMAQMGDRCCPGGVLQAEYSSLPEKMQTRVDELFAHHHSYLAGVLEAGREAGQFQFEGEASDQAWFLLSTTQGVMLSARVHGPAVYDAVARQIRSNLYV